MRLLLASAAFAAGIVTSASSFAATVDSVQGNVSINRGGGFQPVTGSTQAKVGDTVMAAPGGSAKIVYSDGCTVGVEPGSVVSVTYDDHCSLGLADATGTQLAVGAAVVGGAVGAAILLSNSDDKPASP